MNIEWTKCSEQMPPDDDNDVILHDIGYSYSIATGSDVNKWADCITPKQVMEWTPYTEEAWKELNK